MRDLRFEENKKVLIMRQPALTRLNTLTLLAVTALSVSNLLVGLMQGNRFLVGASALLAAAFAIIYYRRIQLDSEPDDAPAETAPAPVKRHRQFPIWMFIGVLFVMFPAMLWFVQDARVS
ncbi:MAG: hypothetical protein AAGL90_07960 [Pseudomonadota bacterium]